MRSTSIGTQLRTARAARGMSRRALAELAGVSVRLVAEFERGERPNVSLETALTLLRTVGLHVRVDAALDLGDETEARAARAARRRATWTGGKFLLTDAPPPEVPVRPTDRLNAVYVASRQAQAIADAAVRDHA